MILRPATIEVAGVQMKVTPPRPNHSLYEYHLAVEGRARITAKLSYDLLNPERSRSLPRVDSEVASQILPLRNNPSFRALTGLVRAKQEHGLGNFRIQKGIVVDIDKGGGPPDDVTITVHRHGAVPVAVMPIQSMSPAESGWDNMRLGEYASLPASHAHRTPLETKGDMLKSCRIHLDLFLRSYLEEGAAEFFDIEHHASRIETFGRLKQIEDVLGAPVKPKLDAILDTNSGSIGEGLAVG